MKSKTCERCLLWPEKDVSVAGCLFVLRVCEVEKQQEMAEDYGIMVSASVVNLQVPGIVENRRGLWMSMSETRVRDGKL